jgi:N-acetylmuramoyl-L-alanine amidase CwlA
VKLKPNKDYFYYTQGVLDNMARLCRYLMNKYNIPKENVLRHYDVSGKSCPGIIGWNPDSGSEATYEAFVNAL